LSFKESSDSGSNDIAAITDEQKTAFQKRKVFRVVNQSIESKKLSSNAAGYLKLFVPSAQIFGRSAMRAAETDKED
jgi:hypothetical protein